MRILSWSFWILIVGGGLFWGFRWAANHYFYEHPRYEITEIEVRAEGNVPRQMLAETAGIQVGENLFQADLKGAHQRLNALPQIQRVELTREPPDKVVIHVALRHPIAWVSPPSQAEDEYLLQQNFLVDESGHVFPQLEIRSEQYYLPVLNNVPEWPLKAGDTLFTRESLAALELIRTLNEGLLGMRVQIQSIDLSKGFCLEVRDRNRASYVFGPSDIPRQLQALGLILDQVERQGERARLINLMIRHHTPVRYASLETMADHRMETDPAPTPPPEPAPTPVVAQATPTPRPAPRATPTPRRVQRAPTPAPTPGGGSRRYQQYLTPWADAARGGGGSERRR
ncbi:MAG: cell division protein FtsQ/DivIB [Verrucomicrobiales bacterium]